MSVRLPLITGSLGVWRGHAPLVAELTIGHLEVTHRGGSTEVFACSEGFVEVSAAGVSVLCRSAERGVDIDRERAEEALERARKRLAETSLVDEKEPVDEARARRALQRAINRLRAAGR